MYAIFLSAVLTVKSMHSILFVFSIMSIIRYCINVSMCQEQWHVSSMVISSIVATFVVGSNWRYSHSTLEQERKKLANASSCSRNIWKIPSNNSQIYLNRYVKEPGALQNQMGAKPTSLLRPLLWTLFTPKLVWLGLQNIGKNFPKYKLLYKWILCIKTHPLGVH